MKSTPPSSNTRRAMLLQTAALSTIAAAPRWAAAQANAVTRREFVHVDTVKGRLRGRRESGFCIFRAVRYAAPPLGKAIFKAPAQLSKWSEVRDALVFGHPALQVTGTIFGHNEPAPDEDCLVLNVWTPAVNAVGCGAAGLAGIQPAGSLHHDDCLPMPPCRGFLPGRATNLDGHRLNHLRI